MAHEESNLNSFAVILGNDVAIKAYREGKFRIGGKHSKSLADPSLSLPAPATNVQFMVKDSTKYATTGGRGSVISKTGNLATRR